jgi:hypothetical protein
VIQPSPDCEHGCEGTGVLPCQFCDGEGNCESQVDVDSFFPFRCHCENGKWECPCVGGENPHEPIEPREASRIRQRVLSGPWA